MRGYEQCLGLVCAEGLDEEERRKAAGAVPHVLVFLVGLTGVPEHS